MKFILTFDNLSVYEKWGAWRCIVVLMMTLVIRCITQDCAHNHPFIKEV